MKKSCLYIIGEQALLTSSYIIFFAKYPERFNSTSVLVGMFSMNLALLLSRLIFLLAEKYKEKYRKSTLEIVKFLIVTTIISLSTMAVSYFAKEPITIRTFCFFVQTFVLYTYLTRLMALKFQGFLEDSDTDFEYEDPTIKEFIEDLSIKYQTILLKELKKVEKRRDKNHLCCDSDLKKEITELELQMILKLLNYIDLCADEFKNDISSKSTENVELDVSTTE